MNTEADRRAPGTTRIPFDAMVEVGGSLGPSFEAQAVNLSQQGMQLRTAYLPMVGQPMTCRFDMGPGATVVATGEVVWNEDSEQGGEFGIRFTNVDGESATMLNRVLGTDDAPAPRVADGRKVRLHIDGLASPMRARIKGADRGASVTAYSELGFLQVGKPLDLEDAQSGDRRPALIDKVSVELEQASRIPQLVVTLRYDDVATDTMPSEEIAVSTERHGSLAPHSIHAEGDVAEDEDEPIGAGPSDVGGANAASTDDEAFDEEEESRKLKGGIGAAAAKITPAVEMWAKRAKTTLSLLAARAAKKRGGSGDDVGVPMRRTTAPAPGGGLHTAGRKVVRGDVEGDRASVVEKGEIAETKAPFAITKKRAVVVGSVLSAVLLAALALHKPSPPAVAEGTTTEVAPEGAALAEAAPAGSAQTAVNALPAAPVQPGTNFAPTPGQGFAAPANDPLTAAAMGNMDQGPSDFDAPAPPHKKAKPAPFGNGAVGHGNVLRIKMDGAIEKIQGASQPTGFTVVLPNRKSLEAAAPLAAKDARIAAIRMSNESSGAELSVTFKDGVPNYLVRAKGDTLELVLARAGQAGERAPEAHATPVKKKAGKKRR